MSKRQIVITTVVLCLLSIFAVLIVDAASSTSSSITRTYQSEARQVFGAWTIGLDEDMNDVTITLPKIQGELLRIVTDQTGADTAWSLTLKDEHGVTHFTSAVMGSVDPNSYALSEADIEGNEHYGVPVNGAGSLVIADANDGSATDLDIIIYYLDWRR